MKGNSRRVLVITSIDWNFQYNRQDIVPELVNSFFGVSPNLPNIDTEFENLRLA
jgi:hypothetical protein